jgi:hypothetical protein
VVELDDVGSVSLTEYAGQPFSPLREKDTINPPEGSLIGVVDGAIIGVGGGVAVEDGVGVWVAFSEKFRPCHMLTVVRVAQFAISGWHAHGLPVYCDVDDSDSAAMRLALMLQFRPHKRVTLLGRTLERLVNVPD